MGRVLDVVCYDLSVTNPLHFGVKIVITFLKRGLGQKGKKILCSLIPIVSLVRADISAIFNRWNESV